MLGCGGRKLRLMALPQLGDRASLLGELGLVPLGELSLRRLSRSTLSHERLIGAGELALGRRELLVAFGAQLLERLVGCSQLGGMLLT